MSRKTTLFKRKIAQYRRKNTGDVNQIIEKLTPQRGELSCGKKRIVDRKKSTGEGSLQFKSGIGSGNRCTEPIRTAKTIRLRALVK